MSKKEKQELFMDTPIAFLENKDFDQSNNLKIAKMNPDTTYMIMVFANWCGPCQMAKPKYKMFAEALQNADVESVRLLAVNATPGERPGEQALAERLGDFGVTGFPTFLVSSTDENGKVKLNKYAKQREVNNFINHFTEELGNQEMIAKKNKIYQALQDLMRLEQGPIGGMGGMGFTGATGPSRQY